jgi:hypothetical protein
MRDFVAILAEKKLSPQSMKNITQVVKSVKASVKDKDGIQMYPTRWNDDFIDMPIIDEEKRRKPSFTGEQVTKIVNGASGRVQMAAILLAATGLRAGGTSRSRMPALRWVGHPC